MATLSPEEEAFLKEHLIEETPESMRAKRDEWNARIWKWLNTGKGPGRNATKIRDDKEPKLLLEDYAVELYMMYVENDADPTDARELRDIMRIIDWLGENPND